MKTLTMKTCTQWINAKRSFVLGGALGIVVCLGWGLPLLGDDALKDKNPKPAVAEEKKAEEAPELTNWITLSGTGAFTSGDRHQFMRRSQIVKDFSGGIEELFLEEAVGKDGTFQMEGRGLFDAHDYLLHLKLERAKIGSVSVGYKEFRTWYDGGGGFFPNNNFSFSLFDEEFAIDRGEAWFEAELAVPDMPVFGFKFIHEFRRGKKDSLEWGDSNMTSGAFQPGLVNSTMRKIVPTFYKFNEQKNVFEGTMKHTVDATKVDAELKYELSDDNNTHNIRRNPFENTDRFITHREIMTSDMLGFHFDTTTEFSEKVLFATGYSFSTINTDIGGDIIYGGSYDAPFNDRFNRNALHANSNNSGFLELMGGMQAKQHVANFNLMLTPLEDLTVTIALRADQEEENGNASYIATTTTAVAAASFTKMFTVEHADENWTREAQKLEIIYKGVKDWVFYARGDWEEAQGYLSERVYVNAGTSRETDTQRMRQKYTVGANWYPTKEVNCAGQYYNRNRENTYIHRNDSTSNTAGSRYPAYIREQDFNTDDLNFRVTWRPRNEVTLVSRYDFQLSTIDNQMEFLDKVRGANTVEHVFGEGLTWSPLTRLYFQANVNYVISQTETPANILDGRADSVVLASKNDYWNTSFMTGYALDDKTDLQAQYYYYRADNYQDNSVTSLPYGVGAEEHAVTLTMNHRLSDAIRLISKYGYMKNQDQTFGGINDYDAHLVYTGLQIAF